MSTAEKLIRQGKLEGKLEGKIEGKLEGKLEGMLEEEYKKNMEFTQSLIRSTDFDVEKIAALVGVSPEFVEEVKKQMEH